MTTQCPPGFEHMTPKSIEAQLPPTSDPKSTETQLPPTYDPESIWGDEDYFKIRQMHDTDESIFDVVLDNKSPRPLMSLDTDSDDSDFDGLIDGSFTIKCLPPSPHSPLPPPPSYPPPLESKVSEVKMIKPPIEFIYQPITPDMINLRNRYRASIILGAVGDTIGYHNGDWEFSYDTGKIRKEFYQQGGPLKLNMKPLIVSDDTVLALATIRILNQSYGKDYKEEMILARQHYVNSFVTDMVDRAPGTTTGQSIRLLERGLHPEFNLQHKTCGGAMRSAPIGLRFHDTNSLSDLFWTSVEYCRLTHNGPLAYMGSFFTALFTSYAINQIEPSKWAQMAFETNTKIIEEVSQVLSAEHWPYVKWCYEFLQEYITARFPTSVEGEHGSIEWNSTYPYFSRHYEKDEKFTDMVHKELSREPDNHYSWSGSCGMSSVMIALDAILYAFYWHEMAFEIDVAMACKKPETIDPKYFEKVWELVIVVGMLHGGDNDSTGILAGSFYGALVGARGVSKNLIQDLEYLDEMWKLSDRLFTISVPCVDTA